MCHKELDTTEHTHTRAHTHDVRQKADSSDFYLSSKWVIKQWRQLGTSTMHLAQELLTNIQHSGDSRSFAKETRALKMSVMASHWKVTTTNWEQSLKLILLKLHEKLPKNSTLTFYSRSAFGANGKGEKTHLVGVSWADRKKKLFSLHCCLLLFYATTTNHFLIGLWCVMESGFYTTFSNDQLSGWTEKIQSTSQN